jgi:hypothetical protein
MKYISGIHALNRPCTLLTCGDWHQSGIQWRRLTLLESEGSLFGDYGIEQNKSIPEHEGTFNVANHIRALLDLLVQEKYSLAQGMNNDFICNEEYDAEIFCMVSKLRTMSYWDRVDRFMGGEYYSKWLDYKKDCKAL